MLDEHQASHAIPHDGDVDLRTLAFTHPDDVLHDGGMNLDDKRAVLAAWASDAQAVPNVPALRQLPSGAIVNVDVVLDALAALDGSGSSSRPQSPTRRSRATRRIPFRLAWCRSRRRGPEDGNDPSPCPAVVMRPGAVRNRAASP